MLFDANGKMPGLVGFYTEKRGRKYGKGPHRPRLADLSDTALVPLPADSEVVVTVPELRLELVP